MNIEAKSSTLKLLAIVSLSLAGLVLGICVAHLM
jgi:hypothetical protein